MKLFSLGKKQARMVALIDIGSASVGGAYARLEDGVPPTLYYTARVEVRPKEGESATDSMLRSLSFLERLMIEEGAPLLRKETGSGAVEEILISIAAPWQDTAVIAARIQEDKPFTFTHSHLEAAISKEPVPEGRIRSGQSVIATILNGYEVSKPFGKRVTRAELMILESTIDKDGANRIRTSLRHAFHTNAITLTGFAPCAFNAFRTLYPHKKDFVVIDVSGSGTDILFVKHGLLAEAKTVPHGIHEFVSGASEAGRRAHLGSTDMIAADGFAKEAEGVGGDWIKGLRTVFSEFSANRALPRTIFLLADEDARDYLKRKIEESGIQDLWLAGAPPSVIPVLASHLSEQVRMRGQGTPDLFLSILALSTAKKGNSVEETPEPADPA